MRLKDDVSKSYINAWHDRTENWSLPYGVREALVVGSNKKNNIGASIATTLRRHHNFTVVEEDIETLDLNDVVKIDEYGWDRFDTVVFANGQTNLDWIENQSTFMIDDVIANKLTASIQGVSEFVRRTMHIPHQKNIVLIGSMAASAVLNGSSVYCAACAGLQHFARCIAWELAPKGYRIFLLNPSNTEGTPMTEATVQGLMEYRGLSRVEAEAYWGAVRALPRWLKPDDIGAIVEWLVTTPEAEWLSGVPLNLGGGLR